MLKYLNLKYATKSTSNANLTMSLSSAVGLARYVYLLI